MTRDAIEAELARIEAERKRLLAELAELAPKAARAGRLRLTRSTVRALPIPTGERHVVYWDTDTIGLGVRVSPHGTKTYFVQCRTKNGRGIKVTVGRAARVTAEQARDRARKLLAQVDLGQDPAAELKAARLAEKERRKAPDMRALWADFERHHLASRRPKTQTAYASWWRLHLEPRLGKAKLADVTRTKVEQLHREVTTAAGAVTANRCLAVLSAMFGHAERLGLVPANVARGVRRHQEHARERVLTDAELARLVLHLDACPEQEARLVELALASGARKGELLAMRWSDIRGDWWTVPAAGSKSGKIMRKPLNSAAKAVLARIERRGEKVFSTVSEGRLDHWWRRARKALDLPGVRLHDLRHAAASLALNAGATIPAISSLLGHGVHSAQITSRYSHLADEQLAAASKAISDRLALLKAEPAGRG